MKLPRSLRGSMLVSLPLSFMLAASACFAQTSARPDNFQTRVDAAALALASNPRFKSLSPEYRRRVVEFVAGNMLFVLLHELGHTAISDMKLPVLGKEEDAADSYAATRLIRIGSQVTSRVVIEAAEGWFMADQRDRAEGNTVPYYDVHGLNQVRAYQIVCFLVGSNKEQFKDLATETKLPQDRQDSCAGDYNKALNSWNDVLKPFLRAPDQPTTKINVVYGKAEGRLATAAQVFSTMRLLEIVAQRTADLIEWPAPFTLEMQSCGFVNARWVPATRTLTLCYELAADFADLYRSYGNSWAKGGKQASRKGGRTRSARQDGDRRHRQRSDHASYGTEDTQRRDGTTAETGPSTIEIGGRRYLWRDIVEMRRRQIEAYRRAETPDRDIRSAVGN